MDLFAYCRYSSEGQRDGYSIEAQVRAITEWAAREGHVVKHFYIDEAKTGTNDDREEFQRMIADAVGGSYPGIKSVVVHKLDRFARDRYDSAVYRRKLKQVGIRVISVLEPLDDSPESVMMEAVLEGMAEYYSKNLSREVRKGKKEAALNGQHNGGLVPYGFRVDENMHYIPEPTEAAVVKEIFRQLNGGHTVADVTRWAVDQGLKTRRGHYFSAAFIAHLIENPLYAGRFVYAKRSRVGQEPITSEYVMEPIVDPAIFDKVNGDAQKRKRGPAARHKEDDYILTGYLFCAICESHLYGFKSHKEYKTVDGHPRSYTSYFYRCARKDPDKHWRRQDPDFVPHKCTLQNLRKERLEEFVIEAIKYVIFRGESVRFIVAKLNEKLKERRDAKVKRGDGSEYKKELAKVKEQRDRLLDLYLSGDMPKDSYIKKAKELEARQAFLSDELKRITAFIPKSIDPEKMEKALADFNESANADDLEYKKRLLATFVDSIAVSNEKMVIYFKFPIPGVGDNFEKPYGDFFVRNTTSVSRCFVAGNMS